MIQPCLCFGVLPTSSQVGAGCMGMVQVSLTPGDGSSPVHCCTVSWVLLETLCTVLGTCAWGEEGRGFVEAAAGGRTQPERCPRAF